MLNAISFPAEKRIRSSENRSLAVTAPYNQCVTEP